MPSDNVFPFERRATPAPPRDFDTGGAIAKCRALVRMMGQYDLPDETCEAGALMLLVNLNDLLQAARMAGQALTFIDHIEPDAEVSNITELAAKCRNAACHVWGSTTPGFDAFRFYRISGYCPRATVIDGKTFGCEFHDDMAIYYGKTRIYLKRHAARALDLLDAIFSGSPAFTGDGNARPRP
jgi:hypothetical protein